MTLTRAPLAFLPCKSGETFLAPFACWAFPTELAAARRSTLRLSAITIPRQSESNSEKTMPVLTEWEDFFFFMFGIPR
jgi:hypothetical protein